MNQEAIEQSTILVVDDTPDTLDVLITLLKQVGFRPLVAQSGEEALERIGHVRPDLILLDVLMPGMDGFEVCRRLKERDNTKDIPVIFMTALSDTIDKVKGFELGAVDYITKPFQHEEVLARIHTHLTLHNLQKQLEGQNRQLQQEISERKQAEEALKEHEARYRELFETSRDGIAITDLQGRYVDCNSTYLDLLGYETVEELRSRSYEELTSPEYHEFEAKMIKEQTFVRGYCDEYEKEYIRKTGERIPISLRAWLRRDVNGNPFGMWVIVRDITERKRVEAELENHRHHLEELVKERTAKLQNEIIERKRAEEEIQKSYRQQSVLSTLLRISMESISLEEQLERVLDEILSIPWLPVMPRGGIFLVGYNPDVLELQVQRDLDLPLQATCARLPFGKCLCGRAAASGEIVFADSIDERHEISYEGMPPHGHYCVPILSGEGVLGTMVLYLEQGHQRNAREEEFLQAIAHTLAGIVERKKAEEALTKSEEKFRLFFENNPDYCYIVSPERVFINVNNAALQVLGYERNELIGKPLGSIYAPESQVRMGQLFEKWKETGKLINEEITIITKSGERRIVLLSAEVVRDETSKPLHTLSIQRDITERKRAEEALRESEGKYRNLVETSQDLIWKCDSEGRFTYLNPAWESTIGYNVDEMIGCRFTEFKPPEIRERDFKTFQKIFKGLETFGYETIYIAKSGEQKHLVFNARMLKDANGNIIGTQGTAHDITERKRAEEALQEWASFARLNPSPVLRFDPKGRIILANPATHTIFGSDALEGRLLNEIFPSVPTEHFVQTIPNDSISTYESQIGEQDYHFMVRGVQELEIGHIYGSNITERKRVEEALKASYEQLHNLPAHLQSVREEERTTIAREIHDELGQALIALKMDLSWLKRRFTNEQTELLEKANAMEGLINSIIQVVKRIVTALRPGLLDDLGLSAAIEWQAEEFQQHMGIQCNVIIDPEDIILKDDLSTAVFRIFQETLTNVARHAHATNVHVLLRETEDNLLLEVRDNGQGITTEQISDPTSFGLIGIRERVEFLGGQVTFQGIPNTGTTVTVSIPL